MKKSARNTESRLPALRIATVPESDYRDLQRRAADAERLAKRVERLERTLATAAALDGLLSDLLIAADDLARAMDACRAGGDPRPVIDGVDLTHRALMAALERVSVTPFPVVPGELFDERLHECLDGAADGAVVTAELRRGYLVADRVLRRALVRVDGE